MLLKLLTTLGAWLRFGVELLGWATVVSLIWFTIRVHQYEHRTQRRYAAPIQVSPVASRIAAKFSPTLQKMARDHRDEVIASLDGPVQRWCVGKVYEPFVDAIPTGVEIATDEALSELLKLPMQELADDLAEHSEATGKRAERESR